MFSKRISETTLTSDVADRLFSNITASNAPDQSFLATLRALLRKRLPKDKNVNLRIIPKEYSLSEIEGASVSACMSSFIPHDAQYPNEAEHNIFIVYTVHQDAGGKMLEIVRANAGAGRRHMGSFNRCDDLQVFYVRKLNALFYADDSGRNTVIFTDQLELKQFHALQIMIPKYLPSLFADDSNPLTEKEIALLKSTESRSSDKYEMLIEGFAKDLDIRSEVIRMKLSGFETAFERMKLNELRDKISRYQSDYDTYLSRMREVSRNIENCQYTLAGLECAINEKSEDSELMDYFMCNKNLSVINVRGTAIEFVAHGYADIYDADAFEQYVENHNGYMYSQVNPEITKVQMERLYRAIFGDCHYKLRLCAAYTADMQDGLRAFSQYSFPPESRTYLPNTHIQEYGCIGSYAGRFQEYMRKKDYVGAVDQAVVSARNLNFYDSAVISTFARELSWSTRRCIEKPDGTLLTPLEAIKELEEEYVETNCDD